MKQIPLSQGQIALIDDFDAELVNKYKWRAGKGHSTWYAFSYDNVGPNKRRIQISLHRLLMGFPQRKEVDHRDGNGLNCQRDNLRMATHSQNGSNHGLRKNNTSGYNGVYRNGRINLKKPWVARVKFQRKYIHIGQFLTPKEAARAYDAAAKIHFGEFARLNFPE